MSTWSTGILADDDAQDVYDEFKRLFDTGKDAATIRKKLERACRPGADEDDGTVFWFALAQVEWDHGVLEKEVLAKVREIVQANIGLERWREQGPRAVAARKKVVSAFLKKIQTPKKNPRRSPASKSKPPKKASKKGSIYQPGDCLSVRLSDGTYGAVLALRSQGGWSKRSDVVGFLNYHGAEPPTLGVFSDRRWLGREKPKVLVCLAQSHREVKEHFELVGNIPLRDDDPTDKSPVAVNDWDAIRFDMARWHGITK